MDIDPVNSSVKNNIQMDQKGQFLFTIIFGLEIHLQVLLCLTITTLKCVAGIGTYMHVFDVKQKLLLKINF